MIRPKQIAFYGIALLMPFILLLLLEGALRLVGFGNSYPLFIEAKSQPGYLQPNLEIVKRYFSHPAQAPSLSPDTHYFKQHKPDAEYRIIIMGGSSAAGFPFGRFGSLSGMLNQRFKRLFPNTDIEVISVAMSAINSYALRDMLAEVIQQQPDLVLMYFGHNEYLGIMGAGSALAQTGLASGSHQAKLWFLQLREWRLLQLMQLIIHSITAPPTLDKSLKGTPLMSKAAQGQQIALGSDLYQLGEKQFADNLQYLVQTLNQHSIDLIVGTLVSNERDLPPFQSTDDESGATALYHQAQQLDQPGTTQDALTLYQQARDADLLRFRAPSAFNAIIRQVATQNTLAIADVEQKFRQASKQGIIGKELLYEHVHPNAQGYFLMAESFVDAILQHNYLGEASAYPEPQAWQDIPLTEVDLMVADFKIKNLMSHPPFTKHSEVDQTGAATAPKVVFGKVDTPIKKLVKSHLLGGKWLTLQQQLLTHYQLEKNHLKAAQVASILSDSFPNNAQTAFVTGQLYFAAGDWSMALYYHRRAIDEDPNNVNYLMMAGRSYAANNNPQDAFKIVQQVLNIEPNHTAAQYQLQQLKKRF